MKIKKFNVIISLINFILGRYQTVFKRTLALILTLLLAVTAVPSFGLEAEAASSDLGYTYADLDYMQELSEKGFSKSYILPLIELHNLHPQWVFEPLLITELKPTYTWSYVFYQESRDPDTNLVSASDSYRSYWDTKYGADFDSGWCSANDACVRYFLDPRNFLNEKDIFQFEDLAFHESVTVDNVASALSGSFMDGTYLENGKTYAEYIYEVGKELNVNPLHLASRMRQEQGSGTSALISGGGGDKLWYYYENQIQEENDHIINTPSSGYSKELLLMYNGYYNFFNIEAAGTGYFPIYLGGMKEALAGTPHMAKEWGGSPSWDTRWKSIYGGAYKIKNKYIDDYQNTLYLQKFNVDPRSGRNFWGQYMQNIGAALSESRTVYGSLASKGALDMGFTFLIPVYKGMPEECPDPGRNATSYAPSTFKTSYKNTDGDDVLTRQTLYTEGVIDANSGTVNVAAKSVHKYGINGFEYSIDGGEWTALEGTYDAAYAASNRLYTAHTEVNAFDVDVDVSGLEEGVHKIAVRALTRYGSAKKTTDCYSYLVTVSSFFIGEEPAEPSFSYESIEDEEFEESEEESKSPATESSEEPQPDGESEALESDELSVPTVGSDKANSGMTVAIICAVIAIIVAAAIALTVMKRKTLKRLSQKEKDADNN